MRRDHAEINRRDESRRYDCDLPSGTHSRGEEATGLLAAGGGRMLTKDGSHDTHTTGLLAAGMGGADGSHDTQGGASRAEGIQRDPHAAVAHPSRPGVRRDRAEIAPRSRCGCAHPARRTVRPLLSMSSAISRRYLGAISAPSRRHLGDISAPSRRHLGDISAPSRR